MELYQLRTFLTVADEGNLTRAAEKMFTSQPAVSAQLRALEEELGVRLFDRSPKGMQLTRAGKALHDQARRIVEAARNFKSDAENLRGAVSGEFVLGLNNRPEILRLMEILHALTAEYPDLSYDLVNGHSGDILEGLEEGIIAIGFFEGECDSARLTHHQLDTIELCLAAPAAWADELAAPDWKKLEAKPWVFHSPSCSSFRFFQILCREQGRQISPKFRVNEDIAVLNLVAEGLGITLTARNLISANGFDGRVVALPHFRTSLPLNIGYQTARAEDPAIVAVRDTILKIWSVPQPGITSPSFEKPTTNRFSKSGNHFPSYRL